MNFLTESVVISNLKVASYTYCTFKCNMYSNSELYKESSRILLCAGEQLSHKSRVSLSCITGCEEYWRLIFKIVSSISISPILTKFSQYRIPPTPPATQYQCPYTVKIKEPSTGE